MGVVDANLDRTESVSILKTIFYSFDTILYFMVLNTILLIVLDTIL